MRSRLYKTYYLFLIALLASGHSFAQQVLINFNAAVYGQSLEGLSFAQLINSFPQDVNGDLTIRVREARAGNVVTVKVPGFFIRNGSSTIDRIAYSKGRFSFGKNSLGQMLSQSGRFPEGDYEYCFELDLSRSKLPGNSILYFENCFAQQIQPLTPLLLVNPIDGEKECNKRPDFLWQPPMPLPAGARFRLVLTELKDKQDVIEAINFNPPLINQGNIPVNRLNFPFNAPELKEGKSYAWQVIMYTGKIMLKKSEIWVYKVKCEEDKPIINTDSYREMKEDYDRNFYVADKVVRFSFNNPYSDGPLNYSIASLAKPGQELKDLPRLKMQTGLNKYDLDLSENKSFKHGQEYLITVQLPNGRSLKLRFVYHNE